MTKRTAIPKITAYFIIKVVLATLLFLIVWKIPAATEEGWRLRLVKGSWSFLIPGIVVSVLRFIVIGIYNARHAGKTVRGNFVLGINRLTVVINSTLFIIALMFVFGINPVEFLTGMTIVAMAIAVTFRDYITNMLSGLFIMFSDQLSVGDFVEVDGNRGIIKDITFSSLVMKNEDGDVLTVPNNMVFTHPLINLSAHNPGAFVVKFHLPFEMAVHTPALDKFLHQDGQPRQHGNEYKIGNLLVCELGKDFVSYKIELRSTTTDIRLQQDIENEILSKVTQFVQPLIPELRRGD